MGDRNRTWINPQSQRRPEHAAAPGCIGVPELRFVSGVIGIAGAAIADASSAVSVDPDLGAGCVCERLRDNAL